MNQANRKCSRFTWHQRIPSDQRQSSLLGENTKITHFKQSNSAPLAEEIFAVSNQIANAYAFVYDFPIARRCVTKTEEGGESANFTVCSRAPTRKHTRRLRLKLFCLNWIDERDFPGNLRQRKCLPNENICRRDLSAKSDFLFVIYYLSSCLANPSSAMRDENVKLCRRRGERLALLGNTILCWD